MGKSDHLKKLGRPEHVMRSGEDGSGRDAGTLEKMLDVWLEGIDAKIHAQTARGDPITVDPETLGVSTSLGVLGVIPRNKASSVIERGFLNGIVLTLANNPPCVQVRLS